MFFLATCCDDGWLGANSPMKLFGNKITQKLTQIGLEQIKSLKSQENFLHL